MGDKYDFDPANPRFYTSPVDITILLGDEVSFDSYRFYAGDLPAERLPTDWKFQISYDGVTYQTVDERIDYSYPDGVKWKGGPASYIGDVDWTKCSAPLCDRIADDNVLRLPSDATFSVNYAHERMAGIVGEGTVSFLDGKSVVELLNPSSSDVFTGKIVGDGTLVVSGGELVLSKADVRALKRIVVRSGAVLSGTARQGDVKIEVEEGGVNGLHASDFVFLIR